MLSDREEELRSATAVATVTKGIPRAAKWNRFDQEAYARDERSLGVCEAE
jgi:hypothetical protein